VPEEDGDMRAKRHAVQVSLLTNPQLRTLALFLHQLADSMIVQASEIQPLAFDQGVFGGGNEDQMKRLSVLFRPPFFLGFSDLCRSHIPPRSRTHLAPGTFDV
jgi:hypothetical protein